MRSYLDASVLVALLTEDAQAASADLLLRGIEGHVIVSDFAAAELASVISRKVRAGQLAVDEAQGVFSDFDLWISRGIERVEIGPADIALAAGYMRRLDLSLRTPDAVHLALVQRLGARLATFDKKMAADAERLGVETLPS